MMYRGGLCRRVCKQRTQAQPFGLLSGAATSSSSASRSGTGPHPRTAVDCALRAADTPRVRAAHSTFFIAALMSAKHPAKTVFVGAFGAPLPWTAARRHADAPQARCW